MMHVFTSRTGRRAVSGLAAGLLTLLGHWASAQTTLNFPDFGLKTASTTATTFSAAATSNSPAAITYTSSNPAIATVDAAGTVTIVAGASGNVVITASQAASGSFPAVSVAQGLLVGLATPVATPINAAAGVPGNPGSSTNLQYPTNGTRPTYTPLYAPYGVVADASGNIYFGDNQSGTNARIYRLAAGTGLISLVAGGGTGTPGTTAAPATSVALATLRGLALDGNTLYVAEYGNRRIDKIDLGAATPTLVTFTASLGTANRPWELAVNGPGGDLFITDVDGNQLVRADAATGNLTTVTALPTGASARGLARASNGDLYIGGNSTSAIYKYTPSTSTLSAAIAITGTALQGANSLAFDASGNLYVGGNTRVYKVALTTSGGTTTGVSSTYAGNNTAFNASTNPAPTNGAAATSGAVIPSGLAIFGNRLFVTSTTPAAVEAVTDTNLQQAQTLTFADFGLKKVGDPNFTLAATASSGLAVTYTSSNPAVATVSGNTVTIVAAGYSLITATQAGNGNFGPVTAQQGLLVGVATPVAVPITTLAGVPGTIAADAPNVVNNTRATLLPLINPYAVAADTLGNVFFVDYDGGAGRVYRVNAAGNISAVAGNGSTAFAAGPALSSGFNQPRGIAVNRAGTTVYVSELVGKRVSRIDLAAGTVTLIAGNGTTTPVAALSDGAVVATNYALPGPWGLAVDRNNNVYINEQVNHTVRRVTPAGSMTIVAGTSGTSGTATNGGAATATTLNGPRGGLVAARNGDLYIADYGNGEVRKVTAATGIISSVVTGLTNPNSLAMDASGNYYIGSSLRVQKYTTSTSTLVGYAGNNTAYNASTNPAPANGSVATGGAVAPNGLALVGNRLYIASSGTGAVQYVTDAAIGTALATKAQQLGAQYLSVYPNPSAGRFTVALEQTLPATATLTVYDAKGAVVKTQQQARSAAWQQELDLSTLPQGLYHLRVSAGGVDYAKTLVIE